MSFNPVVRADPNRMVRVNRSTMQGAFVAGNQRPGQLLSAQKRQTLPPAPTGSAVPSVSSNPSSNRAIIITAENEKSWENNGVSITPASLVVVRSQPVVLTINKQGAFNIEWYARSNEIGETRRVFGATTLFIQDFPIDDTEYEILFQIFRGNNPQFGIIGERYKATVRVLDNPQEPTSDLRLRETGFGIATINSGKIGIQWNSYIVSNEGKELLDKIFVQLKLPVTKLQLNDAEAIKHAPNITWTIDRQLSTAVMQIGDLAPGESAEIAIAFLLPENSPNQLLPVELARTWSETEEKAQAPVGVQRLEK